MSKRSFETRLVVCLAVASLLACSPPAPSAPVDDAEAEAASENASQTPSSRNDAEAARRPDRRAASPPTSGAARYKYVDERGRVQLASRLEDIPERQRSTAMPVEPAPTRPSPALAPDGGGVAQNADITIYTTSYCGYCRAAMAYFDQRGLQYDNRDVENDEEARADYLELTGGRRGVPVVVVGEEWMQGWSKPEFDRLLAAAR